MQTLPSEAQVEEETQTLKNPQMSEGLPSGLTPLGMRESFQDLAPRLPPRARTRLCFFHLELYLPSNILHTTFLGEGKSQIRSLHKDSLMENAWDNEKSKNHKKMQPPSQSVLAAREILTSWVPLCQLLIKKQNPTKAPDPNSLVTKKPGPHLHGGHTPSFPAGCPFLPEAFLPIHSLTAPFSRFIQGSHFPFSPSDPFQI